MNYEDPPVARRFFFGGGETIFWSVVTTCHYQTLGGFNPVPGEICNFCSFLNNPGTNVLVIFGGESPKNFSEILEKGRLFDLRYPQNCQAWQVSALMQRIDWKRHRVWFVGTESVNESISPCPIWQFAVLFHEP